MVANGINGWSLEDYDWNEETGIATLTLNRPDKRNAMSDAMRAEFIDALEHVAAFEYRVVLRERLHALGEAQRAVGGVAKRNADVRGRVQQAELVAGHGHDCGRARIVSRKGGGGREGHDDGGWPANCRDERPV